MTTKEYLSELIKLDNEKEAIFEQIEKLRTDAEGVRAVVMSDMPKSSVHRDMGDVVAEFVDLQEEYYTIIDAYSMMKKEAVRTINRLSNADYRAILTKRYLEGLAWSKIAKELHYCERKVYKLHNEALKEFESVQSRAVSSMI